MPGRVKLWVDAPLRPAPPGSKRDADEARRACSAALRSPNEVEWAGIAYPCLLVLLFLGCTRSEAEGVLVLFEGG